MPAAVAAAQYDTRHADNYEHWQAGKPRWIREDGAVRDFLYGMTGTVLDVPVGTGRFADLYCTMGLRAVGVDMSEPMMKKARARGMECEHGDILSLRYPDRCFDCAVCVRLLNHLTVDEAVTAINGLFRVVRSRLIFSWDLSDAPYDTGKNWTIHPWSAFSQVFSQRRCLMRSQVLKEHHGSQYCMIMVDL